MKRAVTVISVVGVAFALIALTAPVVKAQLIDQIATAQGSSSLCLNRAGGGNNAGTHVIAYNCYDPNDDFTFLWLSDISTFALLPVSDKRGQFPVPGPA